MRRILRAQIRPVTAPITEQDEGGARNAARDADLSLVPARPSDKRGTCLASAWTTLPDIAANREAPDDPREKADSAHD